MRRMDGGKLWQEGGRNGDCDVTCGRHTSFIVDVPVDTRTPSERRHLSLFILNRKLVSSTPEDLVSDDWIFSGDHVVDVGGEPLQEAGT